MVKITRPEWIPERLTKTRKLNFITIHYLYIIGFCILGSVIVYPMKNMAYIDALFFAAGASTQSGLNTIDLNALKTYQQRFDSIVEQSKSFVQRRTISRRKSESEGVDNAERGVAGRTINVLFNSGRKTNGDFSNSSENSTDEKTTTGNRDLQEFRRNFGSANVGPQRPISFPGFRGHGRSRSDANHQLALRQSKPGGMFADSNNDNDYAIEDEEEEIQRPPLSPAPFNPELTGILEKGDADNSTSAPGHITFADPKKKSRRKESTTYVVPSPYEVETRGSGLATKVDPEDEEERGPKDEDSPNPVPEPSGPIRRAITINEPTLTHNSAYSGPRQRLRTADTKASADQAYMYTPPTPGIHRALSDAWRRRRNSSPSRRSSKVMEPMPYLSYTPTIGRNSQFNYGELSDEQKEELGGVEYRSLRTLAYILVGYILFFHVFGILCFLPWIHSQSKWGRIVENDGQSKTWWAIFTSWSCYTDLGFTLTPDSMVSFDTATWPLLAGAYLIIIGNTGFPCMLRFIIWTLWKICPHNWVTKESLHFLLDHPRRCFTLLFPSSDTWWLFAVLVLLNGTDVILFIVLDLKNNDVTELPVNYRILDAFFQAVATRTAGFAVVSLSDLHPGVQVSYLIMMYISVFPIAISVRKTNVYEERSLGIYADPSLQDEENENDPNAHSFVGAHLRRQLSFDLWYVFIGLFVICIAEGTKIANRSDYAFTQFSCLFEVISAYGTVGLSLGYPNVNTSFSAQFTTFSKIVIMAMMVRGRHRGLPYELDRAILLPSESLQQKEEADVALRLQRRADTIERRSLRPMSRGATGENKNYEGMNGNGNANGDIENGVATATGYQPHVSPAST
ncbi:hypothetical protein AA313_de0206978 [Arthrobotrys entomopaga]|nr:hypothetical protein AA313_de0206978 [Arthrobotrys entomopaga]